MHSHSVVTLAWRYRRGAPVDKTLRRVAAENLVLVSTGGSDHVRPSAVAPSSCRRRWRRSESMTCLTLANATRPASPGT